MTTVAVVVDKGVVVARVGARCLRYVTTVAVVVDRGVVVARVGA